MGVVLLGVLQKHMKNKASYTLVLTHDIDFISLRKHPVFSNVTAEFFKRSLWINLTRMFRGELHLHYYLDSIKWCIVYPFVKLGWHPDPWEKSMNDIIEIEKKYNVRSTFFFIPFANRDGSVRVGTPAKGRAIKYDIREYKDLLQRLETGGWEVGVHGLDAHISLKDAKDELEVIKFLLPAKKKFGLRMHWLFQSETLWKNLNEAGYYYDATFGNNDEVGFPNEEYKPFKKDGVWVLPVNIQDGALLGYWKKGPLPYNPWEKIEEVFAEAKKRKAVVTVLWHNNAFGVYHYHGYLYEKIIQKAKADGASICRCIDVCEEMELVKK